MKPTGGNTLTLAVKEKPNQKLLEQFAVSHPQLVLDGVLSEQDSILVGRKSDEVRESFEIWRPVQAFGSEDLEPNLASLVPPPCWLLQITLETDPPKEDWELANALARFVAVACKGAVFYDELGKIIWPEKVEQVSREKEKERVGVVNLSWFAHSSRMSVDSVRLFLDILKVRFAEARPLRFGTSEPFQGRLTPDDDQPFLEEWKKARDSNTILLHFTAKSPCFGGFFAFPVRLGLRGRELKPTEDNMKVHLGFDRAVLSGDGDSRERVVGLFVELAKAFGCFYAHGYVERYYLRYRGLSSDAKTEQYPLPLGSEWYGIPPVPMWLAWFGRPYKSLVAGSVKKFNPTVADDGLLVRLGDEPLDLDQLQGLKFDLPAELMAQEAETDPWTKKYRDERQGRWHYRARSAGFIPRIDN